MYFLEFTKEAEKTLKKLFKKNPKQMEIIDNKIQDICKKPNHKYKNLRSPLQEYKRVHIDKHFILIFKIDHNNKSIIVYNYKHHDEAYRNK